MKIKSICVVVQWRDKINGNTYHSVKIIRTSDGKQLASHPIVYGYDTQYRYTALLTMVKAGWLPSKYTQNNYYEYERDNDYPIYWSVTTGLKRDMINNVTGV